MNRSRILLAFFPILSGCPLVFGTAHPPRARDGQVIDISLDVASIFGGDTRPVACLELPPGWTINNATYTGEADGTPISGAALFDQGFTDQLIAGDDNPPNVWSCYVGPSTTYGSQDGGRITFQTLVRTESLHTIRIALGSEGFGLPFQPIIARRIAVGVLHDYLDDWRPALAPWQFQSRITDVEWGGDRFVAVTDNATALVSSDGLTWTESIAGMASLYGITHGNGLFIAGGASENLVTSPDGMIWTEFQGMAPAAIRDLAYGNSVYLAVLEDGTVRRSTDGMIFNSFTATTTEQLNGVSYGAGRFVAVGAGGMTLYSSDGMQWAGARLGGAYLNRVTYGGGLFVAVGESGRVMTSTAGTTWTDAVIDPSANLTGVTHHSGYFVAVSTYDRYFTSPDGVSWTERYSGTHYPTLGIGSNDDLLIAVGEIGSILRAGRPNARAPAGLDFGAVALGSMSADLPWTISNDGPGELALATLQTRGSADFIVRTDGCDRATLTPAGSCDVELSFAPSSRGTKTATLTLPSNDPDLPALEVLLVGVGTAPDIAIAPLQHDFGLTTVDTQAATRSFMIQNNGEGPLQIGAIAGADPLAAPFAIINDGCSNTMLAEQTSCFFGATFAPAAAEVFSDTFDVPSNDSDQPVLSIALRGEGTSSLLPMIAVADVDLPPDDLAFTFDRVVAGANAQTTITIANAGTAPLVIAELGGSNAIAAPFTIGADLCSNQTVQPGSSCTFRITFSPTAAGTFEDTFDISSNDTARASLAFTVEGAADAAAVCGGSPPNKPVLVSPENGAKNLVDPIDFKWNNAIDPDGDTVTHELYVCENMSFNGCSPMVSALTRAPAFAALFGVLLLFAGRRRRRLVLALTLVTSLFVLSACPDNEEGKTFYWKVVAKDSSGCTNDSELRSFTKAP